MTPLPCVAALGHGDIFPVAMSPTTAGPDAASLSVKIATTAAQRSDPVGTPQPSVHTSSSVIGFFKACSFPNQAQVRTEFNC
jgi:hypothetical protein